VGSIDEPEGQTGISHVLEHMMFKGTRKLKPNEFSRIIAEHGGRENAFTSYEYTGYYQQLEKSRLPISFELEADRMRNLTLDAEEFKKEIQVVMEERRLRTDDSPEAQLQEKFMHTAFTVHPFRNPVIGWMSDLQTMKAEDLKKWYDRWYAPNNAILVVVGDVNPREVVKLAKEHYGKLPARTVEDSKLPKEPPQKEIRRMKVAVPAEVPVLIMGFHVPALTSAGVDGERYEPYALAVLAGILDGGDSARLQKELVRDKRLASDVDVDYSLTGRANTLFALDATPARGVKVEQIENAIREQLERVKSERVTEGELKRIKAQVVAHDVFARDSVYYQAMQLGRLAAQELDVTLLDQYVDRINAVTAEQVQAVARKYFRDENLTVGVLDPLPIDRTHPRPKGKGAGHVR
jgi:zinc protease